MATVILDKNTSLRYDIFVKQGDTVRIRFALQKKTGSAAPYSAQPLTNITWALTASTKVGGTSLWTATLTTDFLHNGIYHRDAAAGEGEIIVVPAQTAALVDGYWELVATFGAADTDLESAVRTLMHGRFVVQQDAVTP